MTDPKKRFGDCIKAKDKDAPQIELPTSWYDPDGDSFECRFIREAFTAKRADDLLTVLIGRTSNKVVGFVVKDVSAYVKSEAPRLLIDVRDGPIRLQHLLLYRRYTFSSHTEAVPATEQPPEENGTILYDMVLGEIIRKDAIHETVDVSATSEPAGLSEWKRLAKLLQIDLSQEPAA